MVVQEDMVVGAGAGGGEEVRLVIVVSVCFYDRTYFDISIISSLHLDHCDVGFSNGGVDYHDEFGEPEEAPRGYRGRGRGRGGRGSFAPGRGYGGDNYAMDDAGGYDDGYNAPPMQGYG